MSLFSRESLLGMLAPVIKATGPFTSDMGFLLFAMVDVVA
jgi:hypothetical protein